ncbi:NAD-dependent epimerase/dehydratase family protein [Pelolinea submarina]|jgi:UDP-glucose 4-epimerase|uniref:UDP-glucose 4-epimerase n=1 Tax=Pelolinea submarina TaxID=913107 RepID=A0A347ZVW4_9CHLR|nr:NAD-dependent epimerase/dehydratase family protein [Pelolinea submarina]REG07141.1 UDP-glucose 4-epimerase [Pelolinea submarina]BBB49445.1 UDP-glucose 4-epimerase [Pelolinea submarina]
MRFLITGAAGFLGAPLANRLIQEGHRVVGLDDLSTGDPERLSPEVHLVRGDVNDRPKLWSLLQEVDCVYHLAARVIVPESVLYPREYNQVNVGGTVTLMEAMRDVGVRRVVFISSGTIYGNQKTQPVRESCRPNPRSPYAVSKLSAEYYIRTIGDLWGIETVCLRVFNAYGPGQRLPPTNAPVIPYCIRQAIDHGTIVVHGDGKQTRDYVYIDDVVDAMSSAATIPDIKRLIINVGSGKETSVSEVIKHVLDITKAKPEIVTNKTHDSGPSRMRADLGLAEKKLGYKPKVSLVEGLTRTIAEDPRFHKDE